MTALAGREALLRGILAAPEPIDGTAWLALVDPPPPEAEAEALTARLARMRAAADSGLDASPAPAGRLARLRTELARRRLDGFLVPTADAHQGESVPPHARRLAWLTGFTGSAGFAVVLAERAAIFVDGRYLLQVENEVDIAAFEPLHVTRRPLADWLADALSAGARLGYDPWLHTVDGLARLEANCVRAGTELVAVEDNPVDAVWADRPAAPLSPAVPHSETYAGLGSSAKRRGVAEAMARYGSDAAILGAPDSIAWLLNMRGGDVPDTPLVLCFAVIEASGAVSLFVDPRKITRELAAAFSDGVVVKPPGALGPALDGLATAGRRVQLDPSTTPAWVAARLRAAGCSPVHETDPCALPKACKNDIELAGARAAHLRDGRALVRFLCWLDRAALAEGATELDASRRLYGLRAEDPMFRGVSFETIVGVGPNGAIVHYRPDARSDRALTPGTVLLVDSGGQYPDGTTDATRTVYLDPGDGTAPPPEICDRYTRVLKGHIALAAARFPRGVTGGQLDTLARTALWRAGLDYDHGTGHGVGSYLGVHEGPQRIAAGGAATPLAPGMILSNEPGYYKTGCYGIRIENLVVVTAEDGPAGTDGPLLGFETITRAPIDRRPIARALLNADEVAWLDAYHRKVYADLAPELDAAARDWLAAACAPLQPG